jgi:hypothetical protein
MGAVMSLTEKIEDAIWDATDEGTFEYGVASSEIVEQMTVNVLAAIGQLDPIEDAPIDGRDILAWDGNSFAVLFYSKFGSGWTAGNPKVKHHPTHWMHLPEIPQSSQGATNEQ